MHAIHVMYAWRCMKICVIMLWNAWSTSSMLAPGSYDCTLCCWWPWPLGFPVRKLNPGSLVVVLCFSPCLNGFLDVLDLHLKLHGRFNIGFTCWPPCGLETCSYSMFSHAGRAAHFHREVVALCCSARSGAHKSGPQRRRRSFQEDVPKTELKKCEAKKIRRPRCRCASVADAPTCLWTAFHPQNEKEKEWSAWKAPVKSHPINIAISWTKLLGFFSCCFLLCFVFSCFSTSSCAGRTVVVWPPKSEPKQSSHVWVCAASRWLLFKHLRPEVAWMHVYIRTIRMHMYMYVYIYIYVFVYIPLLFFYLHVF